jgi:hypothetical protein
MNYLEIPICKGLKIDRIDEEFDEIELELELNGKKKLSTLSIDRQANLILM